MQLQRQIATITVSTSATTSDAVNLDGAWLVSVGLPASLTSTAFTILTSLDGVTYQTAYQSGADISFTCAASKNVIVADKQIVANYVKIVTGSSEAADRTIVLGSQPLQ